MNVIVIKQPGGPEVLQLEERPQPIPAPGEVLIQVMAAGVNRPDVAQRKGVYPAPSGAPQDIPGLEVSGVVLYVGDGVTRFQAGDHVCALVQGGGYAEFCIAPEGQCLPKPKALSFIEAASLPETFFTVWSNVFDRAGLKSGESILIHGGTSGIGVTAIQMAKALGSTVYVTAGTDEKCRFCEELGATKAINYRTADFPAVIKDVTEGKGVNVILDMIGGSYTKGNLESLAVEGRLVIINTMNGKDAEVDLRLVMQKRLVITGSTLRARDVTFKAAIGEALEKNIWPLLNNGSIKPVIYKIFPLAAASEAHVLMESSQHIGKIILNLSKSEKTIK
jgi:NADPH2:quinone reductase